MPEETYTEVDYRNKPYYHQIKRLQKRILTLGNLTQPKALGFWLQNSRSVAGSQQMTEKILKTIFGKNQQLSGNEVYARLKKHVGEIPGGEPKFVRHETAYQTTQRLVPSRGEEEEEGEAPEGSIARTKPKPSPTPINKTLQISALGDVYTKILEKYKNDPNLDSAIRHINSSLAGHFKDAASFIRWTVMTPSWIHIDAFQTDFFNKLKAEAYRIKQEGKGDLEEKLKGTIINELRANEDEFFKTGISHIMRSHPGVKMWTANTPELAKAVEHVRGDVKQLEYYHKLPKLLGFRMIKISDLEKKLHLSQERNALIKHFKPAIGRFEQEHQVSEVYVDNAIEDISSRIENLIKTRRSEEGREARQIEKEDINSIIQNNVEEEKLASAFHQLLDELTMLANKRIEQPAAKKLKEIKEATALRSMKILTYLQKKKPYIMDFVNKVEGPGASIWWADRRMVFENTRFENRFVLEDIRRLAGLIRD